MLLQMSFALRILRWPTQNGTPPTCCPSAFLFLTRLCFFYYTHDHVPIMFAYLSVGPPPRSVLIMSGISVCLVHHVSLVSSTVLVGTWKALDQSLLSEWMHRQVDINCILFSG